ncbi:MAG: hypothetical protein JKY23_01830 [Nitrospinaceae bacterium]|nr:hypothetical protein [Nitrospinaceae bacterium]
MFVLAVLALFRPPVKVFAHEISGFVTGEVRLFQNEALFPGQSNQSASFALQPEYYHEFESGSSFTFVPFLRVDSGDQERTHFDIRELTYLWLQEDYELRVGVRKVFWGTTEVLHLIDIINQNDQVENIDTEDKLGQPMINVSFFRDWGTLDIFMMPFFRERTFQGVGGRLRSATPIDDDRVQYESAAEEWHSDWAMRYSHTFGDLDIGLSQFIGTNREPTLLNGTDSSGNAIKIPRYDQIKQTSVDASYVVGEWLWKLESLYRTGQGNENYFAWTGGFEYTFTRIFNSAIDFGVIGEWMFDTREERATTAFENDIATGLRLAINDAASTEALLGWVQDLDTSARFLFLEASRRFGDNWLLTAELRAFLNQPMEDLLFDLRDDEIMQIELAYYF